MKQILIIALFILASCTNKKNIEQIAEISCGQCQLGLKEPKGCDLAVKINDKAYFIEGAHIDDFGDAHDLNTGFCNVVRKAKVTGVIENNRFKATHINLIE